MSKRISVNDILIRIQAIAVEKGIKLTYTNMTVYLKLIDYAKEYSDRDFPVWTRFSVKTLVLAEYCSVSPRIITETLKKLNECGIIRYTVRHPYPSVVTLYKKYYECDEV